MRLGVCVGSVGMDARILGVFVGGWECVRVCVGVCGTLWVGCVGGYV